MQMYLFIIEWLFPREVSRRRVCMGGIDVFFSMVLELAFLGENGAMTDGQGKGMR